MFRICWQTVSFCTENHVRVFLSPEFSEKWQIGNIPFIFGKRLVQVVVFDIHSSVWKNTCCWRECCTGTLTSETTQRLQPRRAMHNMKELMFQEREKILDLARRLRMVLLGWPGSWLSMSCGRWRSGQAGERCWQTTRKSFIHDR